MRDLRDLSSHRVQLSDVELDQLRAAIGRDAPTFAARLNPFIEPIEIEQPWFPAHRILDVQSNVPFPARRVHVATSAADTVILTDHLENLHQMVNSTPPPGLNEESEAATFASYCDFWTNPHPLGACPIASFDEIPFYRRLSERDRPAVDALRTQFAALIHPEQRSQTSSGWAFRFWIVAMSQLIERVLVVPPDGKMTRHDTVHATHLPVPFGNHWGMVNGRLVPIG